MRHRHMGGRATGGYRSLLLYSTEVVCGMLRRPRFRLFKDTLSSSVFGAFHGVVVGRDRISHRRMAGVNISS